MAVLRFEAAMQRSISQVETRIHSSFCAKSWSLATRYAEIHYSANWLGTCGRFSAGECRAAACHVRMAFDIDSAIRELGQGTRLDRDKTFPGG